MEFVVTSADVDIAGRLSPRRCADIALAALEAEGRVRPVTFSLDLREGRLREGEVVHIAARTDKATRSLAFVSVTAITAQGEPVFAASAVCARETSDA